MASHAIQHGHLRSFEAGMRLASVSRQAAEWDCDEEVDRSSKMIPIREALGGARGAMIALSVETVVAVCLFGAWEILRLL